jgi:hypothetical protein
MLALGQHLTIETRRKTPDGWIAGAFVFPKIE